MRNMQSWGDGCEAVISSHIERLLVLYISKQWTSIWCAFCVQVTRRGCGVPHGITQAHCWQPVAETEQYPHIMLGARDLLPMYQYIIIIMMFTQQPLASYVQSPTGPAWTWLGTLMIPSLHDAFRDEAVRPQGDTLDGSVAYSKVT